MKRCPVCSDLLFRKLIDAVEIDGCATCGGIWLDKGELQDLAKSPQLLRKAGESFVPERASLDAKRTNECPACAQPLAPFEFDRFRGVRLDRCKACNGIWLDHGEANEIAHRLAPAGTEQPPAAAPAPFPAVAPAPFPAAAPVAAAFAPPAAPQHPAPVGRSPISMPVPESSGLELAYDPYSDRGPPPDESAPIFVPEAPRFTPPETFGPPQQEVMSQFDPDRREIPLGKILLGAFALLIVLWWIWPEKFAQVELEPVASETAVSDPCEAKERCVYVLIAPWCPACKLAVPIINGMQERFQDSTKVGIKPVVTYDDKKKLIDMAKTLKGQVYLDPGGRVMKEMGDKGVPHWYVVNASGNVEEKMGGVIPLLQAQIDELGLDDL